MEDWSTNPHEDTVLKESCLELTNLFGIGILELPLYKLTVSSNKIESCEETSDSALSNTVMFF